MYLFFNIILWLFIFIIVIFIFTLIYTRRKKGKLKNKLEHIEDESKLLAIDELRRIIKKDSHNFIAREKLAKLLVKNKSYLPAIKEYLIILDHSQSNNKIDEIKILNKIGDAYLLLNSYEDAKKYFLISKSKDDLNFKANLSLAEIEMLNDNFNKAEAYYNIVYAIEPEDIEIKKTFAICNFKMAKYKDAIEKLGQIINVKSDDIEIIYYLAFSLYNDNKLNEAVKYFFRIKQVPKYAAEVFFALGIIHKKQKLFIEAIEDFNNTLIAESLNDDEKLVELHYQLADCYFESHNLSKAIEHWEKVSDLSSNYKDVQTKLDTYSNLDSNTLLEMYLIGSVNQFKRICKLFVKYYITHFFTLKGTIKFLEMNTSSEGSLEILSEVSTRNFTELSYFVFMRSATMVGDMSMRKLYNSLKEQKADKGVCITAGEFSESAKEFVKSRMLNIVEKEKLVEILNKIGKKIRKSS